MKGVRGEGRTRDPRVTAVVLNWCDADATTECIESLQDSAYPELSLLLVDNGSPDGSGQVLHARHPEVPFLQTGANLGYSGGNNRGIERALEEGAEYVFVVNHDTRVDRDTIPILVAAAESDSSIGAVAPTVVSMDEPEQVWYGGGAFDPMRALGVHWNGAGRRAVEAEAGTAAENGSARPVTFFTGCAVLLSAHALREVGAFEESYFLYVEDAELSVRIHRAGWTILHEPEARVQHRIAPGDADPQPYQIRFRDRNRRRLARTHLAPLQRFAFTAWFFPTRMIHLARYLVRGDLPRAGAIVRGMSER